MRRVSVLALGVVLLAGLTVPTGRVRATEQKAEPVVQEASILDTVMGIIPTGVKSAYEGLPGVIRSPLDSAWEALRSLAGSKATEMADAKPGDIRAYAGKVVNWVTDVVNHPGEWIDQVIELLKNIFEDIKMFLKI